MSSVKGAVNRSSKTSSKNTNINTNNTSTHNPDIKDVVSNKMHEKEKPQVKFTRVESVYRMCILQIAYIDIVIRAC